MIVAGVTNRAEKSALVAVTSARHAGMTVVGRPRGEMNRGAVQPVRDRHAPNVRLQKVQELHNPIPIKIAMRMSPPGFKRPNLRQIQPIPRHAQCGVPCQDEGNPM